MQNSDLWAHSSLSHFFFPFLLVLSHSRFQVIKVKFCAEEMCSDCGTAEFVAHIEWHNLPLKHYNRHDFLFVRICVYLLWNWWIVIFVFSFLKYCVHLLQSGTIFGCGVILTLLTIADKLFHSSVFVFTLFFSVRSFVRPSFKNKNQVAVCEKKKSSFRRFAARFAIKYSSYHQLTCVSMVFFGVFVNSAISSYPL